MSEVEIQIVSGVAKADFAVIDDLRTDLNEHVGATSYREVPAKDGEKGPMGLDIATLAISLLGTPAVVALVGVLKSYFDRDRVTEIDLTGPGGSVRLRLPGGRQLADEDIRRALDSVLGKA